MNRQACQNAVEGLGVVYDDLYDKSVQKYWKNTLELIIRKLVLTYGQHRVQVQKFNPRRKELFNDLSDTRTLLLTNCANALSFNKRKERDNVFSFDLIPCERLKTSNAVPLSWSQDNWYCFFARFQQWLSQTEDITALNLRNNFKREASGFNLPEFCYSDAHKTHYTTVASRIESARLHIKGRNIPVGVFNVPPSSVVQTDANGTVVNFGGNIRQLTDLMFQSLGAKYTPIAPKDRSMGLYQNGSWNGLIGMMLKGDIKFCSAPYYMTHDRYQAIDYTPNVNDFVNTLIIRAPQEETKFWAAITIYKWQVWACLCSSIMAFTGVMWLISHSLQAKDNSTAYHLLYVLRIIVGQGENLYGKTYSLRVLAAVWCLAAVVLVNTYNSMLMSSLVAPYFRPSADSLEDLVYRSDLEPLAKSGTSWETLIMNSNIEAMKVVAQKFRKNPTKHWVDSNEEGVKLVLTGKYAYFSVYNMLQYEVAADFDNYKKCRLYIAKHGFSKSYIVGAMPKGGPANEAYSYGIILLNAHGWMQYWDLASATNYKRGTRACLKSKTQPTSKLLALSDLISAFLVLAVGAGVAIMFFLVEILWITLSCSSQIPKSAEKESDQRVEINPPRAKLAVA